MNQNEPILLKLSNEIQHIELERLKPHPRNEEIYGSCESIADLVELIKLKGHVQPLIIKADGTIISGHRRWRALTALGWKEAPVIVGHFETEEDELFVLIAENRHRQQTKVQRIREGMTVEPLARKLRDNHATRKDLSAENPMENFPLESLNLGLTGKEMQLTENIVAAIVGLGCGRNYRKGRTAVKAADRLRKDEPKLAQVWLDIINNRSVDAGYQIARMSENKQRETLEASAKLSPSSTSSSQQSKASISTSQNKLITEYNIGTWVIVNIPLFPLEKTPERKWNGFWGKISEVGVTLKVDLGMEVVPLLPSDIELIENLTPSFCQVAERILRLQKFDTVHEFGKVILNRMQQTLLWDATTLAYLDAVEQIELARRAIEQAL
ncbi:ParB/RepB/Spo0J family partition protein [Aerosakkonemataceae cyanobacterium BLCC-F50]|uniref:ParB/RepB/Spo0J family partition protein n=1 Tax=Floridaenema flaviceps BLCC-F50 TaxID=3153642 RepID=A0ABV4XTZ2_9CYAN